MSRINTYPKADSLNQDDFLVIDGATYGTRKIKASMLADADEIESLENTVGLSEPTFQIVEGYYIDNSSYDKASINFNRSAPIPVEANTIVTLTAAGYNQSVAMIATCDASGDNIKAVTVSVNSSKRLYSYYATIDTYIIISWLKSQGYELRLSNYLSNEVLNRRVSAVEESVDDGYAPTINATTGKFINQSGGISNSANLSMSDPIAIPANSFITFKATGYLTSVAMIATCDAEGTAFTPVAISEDSNEHTYKFFAEKDCYITVSYKTSKPHYLYVNGETSNNSLLAHIDNVKSHIPLSSKNILSAFTNITCIGDSLTYGAVFTARNSYRQAYKSYPQVIAGETGGSVSNIASTGATALSWWNSYNSQIEEKTNQLAIIYLGTNEGLTDTIDTDCAGNDYTQWAETNTGSYGKIISKFLANNSRVVLVKCNHSSGDLDITNSVIEKFAEKFSVAVVDNPYLDDRKYHYFPDGSGFNTVHYNDLGYAVFAYQLIYNLGELETDMMKRIIPN